MSGESVLGIINLPSSMFVGDMYKPGLFFPCKVLAMAHTVTLVLSLLFEHAEIIPCNI